MRTPESSSDPRPLTTRRDALWRAAGGAAGLALTSLLATERARAGEQGSPSGLHHAPRAKRVIFLYMTGGVSHVDTFDPKPRLFADDRKPISVDNWQGRKGDFRFWLKRPDWEFRPGGESGVEVSDLFPRVREVIDDVCVIRSMESNHTNHYEGTLGMHTGSWTFARPSVGSWVSYGLGTENESLPAFLAIAPSMPYAGAQTWGSDFLPASHQGTRIVPGSEPLPNVRPRSPSRDLQELELRLLSRANRRHLATRGADAELDARIRSFETAFAMQTEAPAIFDLSGETDSTLALYGLERGSTQGFAWQCLVARRLVERGVRFVELIDTGASNNWDSHGDMAAHGPLARNVDTAIAGLLRDLKQRGLLEDTLVVWTTEFGRTPYHAEKGHRGREHHHQAFSSWLAGGGVRGGIAYGSTDDHGVAVAEDPCHVHDFHATILWLLGIDHERLTFRHAGRDYRLTDVHGRVVHDIIA